MKIIVIIPARLKSERLPNKPLLKIEGVTMIRRTLDRVLASGLSPVAVTSDSDLVLRECAAIPQVHVVKTSEKHSCGTERILEAYDILSKKLGVFDWIINVQGDEPFIDPRQIGAIPAELEKRKGLAEFLTTVTKLPEQERADQNVAKVVLGQNQNALLFSREYLKEAWKHTSVYIYTPEFLRIFCSLQPSHLEKAYRLEQMRALDNGFTLNCIPLPYDAVSINTPEDLEKAGITNYKFFQES